jgi:hypothetical protein
MPFRIIIILSVLASSVFSFPYAIHPGMTGARYLTATFNTEFRAIGKQDFSIETPLSFSYGISRNFDVLINLLPIQAYPFAYAGGARDASLTARYQFAYGVIAALGAGYTLSEEKDYTAGIEPALHYLGGIGELFIFFANINLPFVIGDYTGLKEITAKWAGVVYLSDRLGLGLEFESGYYFLDDGVNTQSGAFRLVDRIGVPIYFLPLSDFPLSICAFPAYDFGDGAALFGAWLTLTLDFGGEDSGP